MARAKKGGQVGLNGEFYKGGTFLPNTRLPKQGSSKHSAAKSPPRPLKDWERVNLQRAIEGTKKNLGANRAQWEADGNKGSIDAHEAQIEHYQRKLDNNHH
jgi:hypothetical protein